MKRIIRISLLSVFLLTSYTLQAAIIDFKNWTFDSQSVSVTARGLNDTIIVPARGSASYNTASHSSSKEQYPIQVQVSLQDERLLKTRLGVTGPVLMAEDGSYQIIVNYLLQKDDTKTVDIFSASFNDDGSVIKREKK